MTATDPGLLPGVRAIRPNDTAIRWAGAIDVDHTPRWSRAWRLPRGRIDLFPSEKLRERAAMAAGVRLVFATDSRRIGGRFVPSEDLSPLDLVIDGKVFDSQPLAGRSWFDFRDLPTGQKEVELWLPQFGHFHLRDLVIDDGAEICAALPPRRPRLVTYGSSITQCRHAASPTQTWPALLAHRTGTDLTCLGYSGECHLDPMIARMIRDRAADLIVCCLGINVHGAGTFNRRSFRPAVLGFLSTIRDGHPGTPVIVISPIISPSREDVAGATGMTLNELRGEVHQAVAALRGHGDDRLYLVDGRTLLGADDAHLLFDGVHPDARGYRQIADSLASQLAELGAWPS